MKYFQRLFFHFNLIVKSCLLSLFYYFFQLLFLIVLLSLTIGITIGLFSGTTLINNAYNQFKIQSNPSLVFFNLQNTIYSKWSSKTPFFDGIKGFEDYSLNPSKIISNKSSGLDSGMYLINKYFNNALTHKFGPPINSQPYFSLMFRDTRVLEDSEGNSDVFKVVNFDPAHNNTDKVIIKKGRAPEDNFEIMVSSVFARRNNIFPGNYYYVFGQYFKVVGIADSWDFTYPLINVLNTVSDNSTSGIIYCYKTAYYKLDSSKMDAPQFVTVSNVDREMYLIGGLNNWTKSLLNYNQMVNYVKNLLKLFNPTEIFQQYPKLQSAFGGVNEYFWSNKNSGYYYYRTTLAWTSIKYLYLFSIFFSIFIIFITLFIFYNVFKRRFALEKVNFKVFSFLGYTNKEIKNSYLSWPFVIFFLSFILILFIGFLAQWVLIRIFNNFFIIPITINFVPFVIVFIIIFFIAFLIICLFNLFLSSVELSKILEPE